MAKTHKNNSEFEFCALVCIMPTDKVTGCARLIRNSEFGISVSAYADEFK